MAGDNRLKTNIFFFADLVLDDFGINVASLSNLPLSVLAVFRCCSIPVLKKDNYWTQLAGIWWWRQKKTLNVFTTSKPLTLNTIVYSLDIFHLLVFIWRLSPIPSKLFEGQLIRDPSVIIMQITTFSTISFGVNKWQSNLESVVNASAWVHSSDTKLLERETKVVVRRWKRKLHVRAGGRWRC